MQNRQEIVVRDSVVTVISKNKIFNNMNNKFYKIFSFSLLLLFFMVMLFQGCSEKADNLSVVSKEDASCSKMCHGNSSHTYPPQSLAGYLLPTDRGVGSHEAHMNTNLGTRNSAPVACGECHLPVYNYDDSNHIGKNPGTAEVIFGSLAKKVTNGFTPNPVWNSETQTCSNTYCHGYFKGGNPTAQPVFNNPGSVVCGSCHGNPSTGDPKPVTGHQYFPDNCWYCHGIVVDSNRTIINKTRHINGVVDFNVMK